ncbi:hypothetical protein BGY98DRAFT_994585 [Russula aff. rugulosa BPL654]|nr:hypothetical protein BGY98DRAFT_994585 [Russula aff. rugulosa BPL654]
MTPRGDALSVSSHLETRMRRQYVLHITHVHHYHPQSPLHIHPAWLCMPHNRAQYYRWVTASVS